MDPTVDACAQKKLSARLDGPFNEAKQAMDPTVDACLKENYTHSVKTKL
jgi:hypothetical protein